MAARASRISQQENARFCWEVIWRPRYSRDFNRTQVRLREPGSMGVGPLRVFDVDDALRGEELSVAAVAGRHHAVEHVDSPGEGFQQVGRQLRGGDGHHFLHLFVRFAHAEAADGGARKAEAREFLGTTPCTMPKRVCSGS